MNSKLFLISVAAILTSAFCSTARCDLPLPEELYSRMWNSYQSGLAHSGTGLYARKISGTSHTTQEHAEADTVQIDRSMVERYYISGDKYRIDRWMQSSDLSVAEIIKAADSITKTPPDYQIIWNGGHQELWDHETFRELNPPDVPAPRNRLTLSPEKGQVPDFLTKGRALPDADLIKTLNNLNFPMEVVQGAPIAGDDTLVLRIGKPDSVGFYLETTVLPRKGYVTASAIMKSDGIVKSEEEYSGFVEVLPDVWVATKFMMKTRSIDKDGVPYVSSSVEMVAVEAPTANCVIDDALFTIHKTEGTLLMSQRVGGGHTIAHDQCPQQIEPLDTSVEVIDAQTEVRPEDGVSEAERVALRRQIIFYIVVFVSIIVGAVLGMYLQARRHSGRNQIG